MASYKIAIKRSAAKELEDLPTKDRRRVVRTIQRLADEPRPPDCEKLSAQERYRLRQGDYRILYEVDDGDHLVTVVRIGQRGDVYR